MARRALKEVSSRNNLPCEQLVLLLGVLDEHHYLRAGEVLVANGKRHGKEGVFEGKVVVCRSPCNHPGDVQLATAVRPPHDRPEFEYLANVLVFSAAGDRPLADMLSGADFC
jgi:hypothetical protein